MNEDDMTIDENDIAVLMRLARIRILELKEENKKLKEDNLALKCAIHQYFV